MKEGYSINLSERGKDYLPITGVVGFSADKKRFTVNVSLKPIHVYEFIVTNRSFKSQEGYPLLKDYTVKFKTKP